MLLNNQNRLKSTNEFISNDDKDQLSIFMYQTPFFQWCLDTTNQLSNEMLKIVVNYLHVLGKAAQQYKDDLISKLTAEQKTVYEQEQKIIQSNKNAITYSYESIHLHGFTMETSYVNPLEEVYTKQKAYREKVRGVYYDEKNRKSLEINTFTRYGLSRISILQSVDGEYYVYSNSGVYKKAEPALLKQLFRKILDEYDDRMWSTSYENKYIAALVGLVPIDETIHEGNANIINFKNGVYDLEQNKFFPHSHKYYSLVQLGYDYNAAAKCPNFEKFLRDIFDNDTERILLIKQMLGNLLLRDIKIHKAFIFLGNGSNGKSVLAELIAHLLGKANVSTTPLSKLNGTFALQNIHGKLVNISTENEIKTSFNTQDFKMITSGDMVEVEKKYKNAFSQKLITKLIILLNKMMNSDDRTDGYYRRLQIIPFNKTYVELKDGEEPKGNVNYMNPCLIDDLLEELPGIMNFTINGLNLLKSNGFHLTPCRASDEALEKYKRQQNPIEVFVDECVNYSKGSKIKRSDVTKEFEKWLNECGINSFRRLSKQSVLEQFLDEIAKRNWTVKESKVQGHMYLTNLKFDTIIQENDDYVPPTI